MITITQLLESVDLDFEPRWVTQDACGDICICDDHKPEPDDVMWDIPVEAIYDYFGKLNIAEFANKPWQECIYEVPPKTDERSLEKLRPADSDLVYRVNLPRKTTGKIEKLEKITTINHSTEAMFGMSVHYWLNEIIKKQGEIVDAVNELKGA